MRVLYFIDGLGSGGAQRQSVELAARLVGMERIEASFVVYRDDDFFGDRLRSQRIPITLLSKSAKLDPSFIRRLRREFKAVNPDIVHSFLLAPSFWSALTLASLPRSARPHFLASERNTLIATDPLRRVVQSFSYHSADAVTVNAEAVVDLIDTRLRIPRERIHYIPNGIDLQAWDAAQQLDSPLYFDRDRFHVGLVGRMERQKNHLLLLRALSRIAPDVLSSWKVWLIGNFSTPDSRRPEIEREIHRWDLSKIVEISPPQQRIAAILKRLDALVLPSIEEGFPNVVLEAMASGIPVVATRVGDVANLIDDAKSGFIVPPDDEIALSERLLRLHRLGLEARRSMGAVGRRIVEERFQLEAITGQYSDLYQGLSGGGENRASRERGRGLSHDAEGASSVKVKRG